MGDDLLSFNRFRERMLLSADSSSAPPALHPPDGLRKLDVIYCQSGKPSKNARPVQCLTGWQGSKGWKKRVERQGWLECRLFLHPIVLDYIGGV